MQSSVAFDNEEKRTTLLRQARQVCLLALQRYDLDWSRVAFVQFSESVTYRITTTPDSHYLLRIHVNQDSPRCIASELEFLRGIAEHGGLAVPTGVTSIDGTEVLELAASELQASVFVTLMHWVDGESANGNFTDNHAAAIGTMMAKLHVASALFVPSHNFTRPRLDAESFQQKSNKLEMYYDRFVSDADWQFYRQATVKVLKNLSEMEQTSLNYGLVHGDLHLGNIVFHDGVPAPIDFGLCGHGYYLYDVAAPMLSMWPKHRWMLLSSYEALRPTGPGAVKALETFFIMIMIENYSHHASNPREAASLKTEQPYALAYLKLFLDGEPFLFEVVEPVKIESD